MRKQTLREYARRWYLRLSILCFGNHVGLRVNLLYGLYMLTFRVLSTLRRGKSTEGGASVVKQRADELRSRGFVQVPPFFPRDALRTLQGKVDALFAEPRNVVYTLEDGGLIRLKDCTIELPEIEQFVCHTNVSEVLRAYFGGEFKTFSVDVYRTEPSTTADAERAFSSLEWHFDNCPSAMIKLMIYFCDTNASTGALTVIPKRSSKALKDRGFWDRREAHNYRRELHEAAVRLEGNAGTVLIFSTHHCIHKATLPETGHRDVAVLLVQPALSKSGVWTERKRLTFSRNYGYCINPFTDQALRVGDE